MRHRATPQRRRYAAGGRHRTAEGPGQRGAGDPPGQPADHARGRDAGLRHPYRAVRGPAARALSLRRRAARGGERRRARLAAAITSRIKIMARLDIAERRLPQDGRIKLAVRGQDVDFRVSTIPSLHGETVVLRILDRTAVTFDYAQLGLSAPVIAQQFGAALELPNGIVLVTGPTGSGKTTTLYTGLLRAQHGDPQDRHGRGPDRVPACAASTRSRCKPQIGLTFASLLRSILRQDPDVIMVGEIRDLENRADRGAGGADRASGAVHAAHQLGRRRHHPAARHGAGGLSAHRGAARRAGAAAGAPAVPRVPPAAAGAARAGASGSGSTERRRGRGPITLWHAVGCPPAASTGYRGRPRSPSSWSRTPRSSG